AVRADRDGSHRRNRDLARPRGDLTSSGVTLGSVRLSPAESWLDAAARQRLVQRIDAALRRARASGGSQLVSVSARLDGAIDPSAIVACCRRPGEPWFCLEQPDRDGLAVAALGSAR